MGAIRARSKLLFFDFRYQGVRRREQTKLADTPANRKRAVALLERMEAEILLGTFNYAAYFPNSKRAAFFERNEEQLARNKADEPLFKDFAEQWFAECQVGWKHSYKITLRTSLDKHILPTFGASPVCVIKKADVLAFRANLAKIPRKNGDEGLSPARINHIMVPLRMILNEAAERYEFDSPYKNIKPLRVPRTKVDPFTLDEVQRTLNQVRPDFRPYYTVRFFTGMRTGEVHGLRWRYVDFDRRQILIRESFVANEMTDTKTDGSAREIHMSQPVYEALLRQKKTSGGRGLVFCNGEGNPLSLHNVTNRVWYPLLRHLELPLRRPYQTRHTAATLWLAAGENPEWIARQMGHTTTEMLFRVYSRYVPNLTRQDGSAFEAVLRRTLNDIQDDDIHGGNL